MLHSKWLSFMRGAQVVLMTLLALAGTYRAHPANSIEAGDLVIANYSGAGGTVARVNPTTGAAYKLGTFVLPTGVAVGAGGVVYVTDWMGTVNRLDLKSGTTTLLSSSVPLSQLWGIALASSGDLYLTSGANNRIIRLNPATGMASVVSSGLDLQSPIGIAALDANNLVVASQLNSRVINVRMADGLQTALVTSANTINQPWGIAVSGNDIYVGAHDSRQMQRISSGVVTVVAIADLAPLGIAVSSSGEISTGIADILSGVYKIQRFAANGAMLGYLSGPLIGQVTGLMVAPETIVANAQANTPPQLVALSNYTVGEGEVVSFTATAVDTNWPIQSVQFSLDSGAPAGAQITPAGSFSWMPTEAQGPGLYAITVRATDNGSPVTSAAASFTVNVVEKNVAPVLAAITNRTVTVGGTVSLQATATDADLPANLLTFGLAAGAPTNATITTAGLFVWTPITTQAPSTNTLRIKVTDNGLPSLSSTQAFTVTVKASVATNKAPVLGAIAALTVTETTPLAFNITATDSDVPAQTLLYALQGTVPAGASLSSVGAFSWTPSEAQGPSTHAFTVVVSDSGLPSLTATQSFSVIVLETNAAPVLAAISNRTVTVGGTVSLQATATDADLPAQSLSFSLGAGAPVGAVMTPVGAFSWTPTVSQLGTFTIPVVVTDGGSPALSANGVFDVVVTESLLSATNPVVLGIPSSGSANPYPSAITVGLTGVVQELTVSLGGLLHPRPGDLDVLLVSPSGRSVMLMSDSGGTNALTSANAATLTFSDVAVGSLTTTTLVSGTYKPTNLSGVADSFVSPAPTSGWSNTLASLSGTAANGLWKLYVRDNSSGPSTTTGAISGWSLSLRVSTAPNTPPVLAPSTNLTVDVGQLATFTVKATDADLPAQYLSFRLGAGSPAGATLTSGGVFAWTPTAAQAGTNTFPVVVTDSGSPALSSTGLVTTVVRYAQVAFSNSQNFSIPSLGSADLYPSVVTVATTGVVYEARIALSGLRHPRPSDLDVLLVNPAGVAVLLMSDCGGTNALTSANAPTLTFSDAAAGGLGSTALVTGTYRPSDLVGAPDTFAAPAPAAGLASSLAAFVGGVAGGTWSLYFMDNSSGPSTSTGSLDSGWTLTLRIGPAPAGSAALAGAGGLPGFTVTTLGDGRIRLAIHGAPQVPLVLESTEDLLDPVWQAVGDVLTSPEGTAEFLEEVVGTSRFYRVVRP